MKDGDTYATLVDFTTAGLQAAIDFLAGGKGKVFIGPGTLQTTTAIWLHSGVHLQGSGITQTVIQRTSMSDSDAVASGSVLQTGPYGSNGTRYSSGTSGTDITISDLTVDGNYTAFSALTNGNLLACGIATKYVDGIRIFNVRAQNLLADGFRLENSRNVTLSDIEVDTVGQWSQVVARNGVNFIGDYAAAGGWGYNYSLNGASMKNIGDEAIQASNITLMSIVDVSVDGCDFVLSAPRPRGLRRGRSPTGPSPTSPRSTSWTTSSPGRRGRAPGTRSRT